MKWVLLSVNGKLGFSHSFFFFFFFRVWEKNDHFFKQILILVFVRGYYCPKGSIGNWDFPFFFFSFFFFFESLGKKKDHFFKQILILVFGSKLLFNLTSLMSPRRL